LGLFGLCTSALYAQAEPSAAAIRTYQVRPNLWMLITADGNLALQVGTEGALLVDTGRGGTSDAVLAAIRQITKQPLRYIINTSAGPMQIGNNAVLGALKGGATDGQGKGPTPAIIANEAVLAHMNEPGVKLPALAWPSDAYAARKRSIRYNGEAIDIIHAPSAYSDSDSIVYFRRSDVIVAGEIFSTNRYPLIDPKRGGTVAGVLAGLNQMLDIAVPDVIVENYNEDGTLIIPGSGRLCDRDDLTEYHDMVNIVRDRMVNLVSTKRSLEEVKAARPLVDYEQRYSTPEWTTSMFIDAFYTELAASTSARSGAR
jgi:glyoxylase-like metal-dependent hydrolase (beta-lactamase superfamily II)